MRTADVAAEYPTLPIAHLWLRLNSVLEDLLFCSVFEAPDRLCLKKVPALSSKRRSSKTG